MFTRVLLISSFNFRFSFWSHFPSTWSTVKFLGVILMKFYFFYKLSIFVCEKCLYFSFCSWRIILLYTVLSWELRFSTMKMSLNWLLFPLWLLRYQFSTNYVSFLLYRSVFFPLAAFKMFSCFLFEVSIKLQTNVQEYFLEMCLAISGQYRYGSTLFSFNYPGSVDEFQWMSFRFALDFVVASICAKGNSAFNITNQC